MISRRFQGKRVQPYKANNPFFSPEKGPWQRKAAPHHLPTSWPTVASGHPLSPQLLPLMTNLFPGMSVEEVLGSQTAQLARLQLERVVEHSLRARPSQDIMG